VSAGTDFGDIRYEQAAGIATITIDRAQVHNAFREQTMHELIAAFDRADAAPGVGVIVLTGAGEAAFSAGGDVEMENAFDRAAGKRIARVLMRLAEAVRGTGKPVIAKVRGWCVGGGNELMLLCDFALAAESARFCHTDSKLGNSPVWYGTQLLPQLVGTRRAKEIIMLGRRYSAAEAAQMGWINGAFPDAELDDVVAEWCASLLASSPQALSLSKASLNYEGDQALPSVRHGLEALAGMYETAEFREGTLAFLEHRAPDFRRET
jgi:dihydroxynaphthoic acid synthetase